MAEFIKQSWFFPAIQSIHILGITLLVGTIFLIDLRLLGTGMRRLSARDLVSGLAPWTSGGLLMVLVTGPLLFGSDLARYVNNPAFILKMVLLAASLAAHFTIHRSVVRNDPALYACRQKLAAVLSLTLWSSVVLAGRAIADFDIRLT